MVLLATVVPYSLTESDANAQLLEILKILINFSEVIFINFALNSRNSFNYKESSSKIYSVAISKNYT